MTIRKGLGTQLLFSHLILVGLMLVVMLIAVAGFFRLGQSIDRILEDNYKSVVAAQNMKESLERIDSSAAFYLAGQRDKAREQYGKYRPRFEEAYRVEATNITEEGEQQISDDLENLFATYQKEVERMVYANPPMPLTEAQKHHISTLEPLFVTIKQRVQDVLDLNQGAIVRASDRAKAEARQATGISLGLTVLAVLLGLGVAWRNIKSLMTPIVSLTRQAEEIGAGHLGQRIETRRRDELGQLARTFNRMAVRLREARRLAEERLHRAERMSDVALENLYDPVIVTDAEGRVVHLNRAAEGLFGPTLQAQGQAARTVVKEERLAHAIEGAVKQERVSAGEGESAQVRLAERTYRLRANPMTDEAGTLLGAVAVLEDITHLTDLDRLKTEFIGVASHELRTPVTSLMLSAQLLEEGAVGSLTPEQAEVVKAQRQDLARLERMMRDLLDLTRLEAGASLPRFEVVSPLELLTPSTNAVETQAKAKEVDLIVNTVAKIPNVRADRGQIGRVLVNLLSNAIRHTPVGGSVSLTAEPGADGTVIFSVTDTGVGIPAAYLPRIFERFVQVPGATRGGAGLGLSISEAIVKAHGGTMSVESEPGKGSTFRFTLRIAGTESRMG